MDCSHFLDRYSEYDDSLLTVEELSRFRAHLDTCDDCARYDHILRKGRMVARQLPAAEPDERRRLQLHSRIAAARWRRRGVVLSPLATGAMAALTILLVATSTLSLLEAPTTDRMRALAGAVLERDGMEAADAPAPFGGLASSGTVPAAAAHSSNAASGSVAPGAAVTAQVELGQSLPALSQTDPRPWGAQRVDRRVASAYSPLVTGPPAYRAIYRRGSSSGRGLLD